MSTDLFAAAFTVVSLAAAFLWAYCDDCRTIRRHRARTFDSHGIESRRVDAEHSRTSHAA